MNILASSPAQRRRAFKRQERFLKQLDKISELKEVNFSLPLNQSYKVYIGDIIDIKLTTKYGNKKEARMRVVEVTWDSIHVKNRLVHYKAVR